MAREPSRQMDTISIDKIMSEANGCADDSGFGRWQRPMARGH
jgi:hypothetical protein